MSISLGTVTAAAIRLGTSVINKVYLGTTLVYTSVTNVLDTTSMTASDAESGVTAEAYAIFNANGSVTLVGNAGTSPSSPRWWTTTPPATWMEYSSTGTGIAIGGLTAGTRYEINTGRQIGILRSTVGTATRVFTVSFYDAASGGTLLGTKTFTADVEFA